MNKNNYIQILENPSFIQQEHTTELKLVIEEFPYFQSARALYLKALKNQSSFKYNNELKITASYIADRTILFDFITSEVFNNVAKNETLVVPEEVQEKPQKDDTEEIAKEEEVQEIPKDKEEQFVESVTKDESEEIKELKKELDIGKPLSFSKSEAHSFNQWLQLSAKKGVQKPVLEEPQEEESIQRSIIDQFITNNPKIPRISKTAKIEAKTPDFTESNELMTETLAKVYLEQKKYENAIQAYKILSLKYPEKSGFFADQIKRIQILQKN